MARVLKDICKDKKTIEVIKQYEAAKRFWLCSPGEDDELNKRRRAFVTAYSSDLEELYQASYGNKKALSGIHFQENLGRFGVQELLEDYHWMKQDKKYLEERRAGKACTEKERAEKRKEELSYGTEREEIKQAKSMLVAPDPLEDPSITEEQRNSLKAFHQWLYRNSDKTGAQILGSDGTMRNLAEDFMSRPAREQLKALYLLETNKRKTPSEIGNEDRIRLSEGAQDAYVPNLDHLKEKMIATKWKFWKRRNGSHLYWEKLQDALNQAENSNHPINGKAIDPKELEDENEVTDTVTQIREEALEAGKEPSITRTFGAMNEPSLTKTFGAMNEPSLRSTLRSMAEPSMTGFFQDIENPSTAKTLKSEKEVSEDETFEDAEEPSFGDQFDTVVEKYGEIAADNIAGRGLDQHANVADLVDVLFDKSYDGAMEEISNWMGIAGTGLHIIGSVTSAISDIKSLGWGVKVRAGEKVGQGIDLLADLSDSSSYSNDMVSFFVEESSRIGNNIRLASGILGIVTGSAYTAKAATDLINLGIQHSDAEKAEKAGRETGDEFLEKTGKLRQRQLKRKIGSSVLSAMEGLSWLGGGIGTLYAVSLSWAMPVAGITAMAVGIGNDIYNGTINQKIYRDTADTYLFNEGKDLPERDTNLINKLNARKRMYPKNSKEYKYLDALGQDTQAAKEKRYDILRRDKLKEEKCCSLRGYHEKAMDQVGEKILSMCFKDENGNLISREQKKELLQKENKTTQERVRIGYKDLAKSFGINTKMASSRKLQSAEHRKKEESKIKDRIQEGMHR